MRAIGIDWGERRIGLAVCDSAGTLATPYDTITYSGEIADAFSKLQTHVVEVEPELLILGLPRSLSGDENAAAGKAREVAASLEKQFNLPVELVDERLTSNSAHQLLAIQGVPEKKRKGLVDQVAAALILQSWLDSRAS